MDYEEGVPLLYSDIRVEGNSTLKDEKSLKGRKAGTHFRSDKKEKALKLDRN